MEYRIIKEISLLTLAQAGPKGCEEFAVEHQSLAACMAAHYLASFRLIPGKAMSGMEIFISWAESKPSRIAWVIKAGFAEKVEPELKPCPFHQGAEPLSVIDEDDDGFYIRCKFCYARGPHTPDKKWAIEAWNRRA